MPTLRYHIVPQGLMMSVNGDPTYWYDRKATLGILWEHIFDDQVEILRHGRVEMIIEREASHRAFYNEIRTDVPKTGAIFVTIDDIDPTAVEILNRVLAGEEKPIAIVRTMQGIARDAVRRAVAAQNHLLLDAA